MRIRAVLWIVGLAVCAVAVAQVPALVLAIALGESWSGFALSLALGLLLGGGAVARLRADGGERTLDHRSAFLAITGSWLAASLLGAAPFIQHAGLPLSPLDALFESVSGFTTTGSSIIRDLETAPRSLLLWRSITQWLGGMGAVLIGVAVLPILGVGGMQLLRAEAPGPTKDKLTPRVVETARRLWLLYVGLSLAGGGLFYVAGLDPFDAVCHALTTVSTGGFSTHQDSYGHFDSGAVDAIAIALMLLGGTSFAVLHRAFTHGVSWVGQPELRLYVAIFAGAAALVSFDLLTRASADFPTLVLGVQHGVFQAASLLSGAGFTTRDPSGWPPLAYAVLFALVLCGGMAGSTSGGVKVVRVLMAAKLATAQFFRLVHPRGFTAIKLDQRSVEDEVILAVAGFVGMWVLLLLGGTALLTAFGLEWWTALSAATTNLGNVGPGLGEIAGSGGYAALPAGAKLTLMMLMLLGRLEVYTVLVLLTPGFWRR